jgi:carbon storage regulator CsrA
MLVLSRKNNESVIVEGGDGLKHLIKVTLIEIGRGVVKLGFEANRNISVNREEIWERLLADRTTEIHYAPHDALDRWADDGGGSVHVETILKATNFGRKAGV